VVSPSSPSSSAHHLTAQYLNAAILSINPNCPYKAVGQMVINESRGQVHIDYEGRIYKITIDRGLTADFTNNLHGGKERFVRQLDKAINQCRENFGF